MKAMPGSVNIDVGAGAIVRPDDVIVGDIDGIVVIQREHAARACRSKRDTKITRVMSQ